MIYCNLEEILVTPCRGEIRPYQGKAVTDAIRQIGISKMTFYLSRKEYQISMN